jgi:tetratricopeptide (TPR) repeat protein
MPQWNLSQKSQECHNLKGLMELFLNRVERALACFEAAIILNAHNPIAILGKARTLALRGKPDEALSTLSMVSLSDDARATSSYERSELLMKMKREKEAEEVLGEGLSRIPRSALLNYKKAEYLGIFKEYRSFHAFYGSLFSLDGRFPPLSILKTQILLQNGLYSEALSCLHSIEIAFPEHTLLLLNLGFTSLLLNVPGRALDYFNRIITLNPLKAKAYLGKGIAHYRMGDYRDGRGAFLEYIKLSPGDHEVLSWLGALEFECAHYDLSGIYFERALTRGGRRPRYLNNSAIYHYRKGNAGKALTFLEQSLRVKKENPRALLAKGLCEKVLGKKEEALNAIKLALYYQPRDSYAWLQRGLLEYELNQLKLSLESFIKCTEVDEKSGGLFYNKALAAARSGELHEAQQALSKAQALNPEAHDGWHLQAWLHAKRNEKDLCRKALDRAGESRDKEDPLDEHERSGLESENPPSFLQLWPGGPLPFDLSLPPIIEREEPLNLFLLYDMDKNFIPPS